MLYLSFICVLYGVFKKFSDKNLIEGIRNQDDKVLNWIYENYLPLIRKHILQNSGNQADVSDIFQDTIIILYDQVVEGSFKLKSDLKGYFYGIAKNRWKEQLRSRKETLVLDEEISDDPESEEISSLVLERIISRAFNKLKPDYQAVLKLYSEGRSYEDIAKELDLKTETNARRKKYISKEALLEIVREDPEYQEYLGLRK